MGDRDARAKTANIAIGAKISLSTETSRVLGAIGVVGIAKYALSFSVVMAILPVYA